MRGTFGKPQGTVARGHIGQVIMSIWTKLQNKEHVIEALHSAKFKFPGCQKIHISKKWGFTKFNADAFEDMAAEKQLIQTAVGSNTSLTVVPWTSGGHCAHESLSAAPSLHPPINPTSCPKIKAGNLEWTLKSLPI
uniref:Ribosomal protein L10e/L16 domain-containing protein n=1 Tax=Molossus molossus TaxID=27622 RepID=A0A7J8EE50_MOLMO|nr:hypothetical protein HJG59_008861 [Molossus molossus]